SWPGATWPAARRPAWLACGTGCTALAAALPGRVELNGPPDRRLPGTLKLSITGLRGHDLLAATPGVAASTGSACHSGQHRPSPVLIAMALDENRALAAIRLSAGRWTTETEIDDAADQLAAAAIRQVRACGLPA